MFCVGMNAMLAQIIMTRELMVVFFGNELALGIVFAAWLIMVGAGSLLVRPWLGRTGNELKWFLMFLLVILASATPLLIFMARGIRLILHIPAGECLPLASMVAAAFMALAPPCLTIGMIFPCACRLAESEQEGAASVYTAESSGSMFAGLLFSFVLVFLFSTIEAAFFAALAGMLGTALIAPAGLSKKICWLAVAVLAAMLLFPVPLKMIEHQAVDLRWEAFGVLPRKNIQQTTGMPCLIETKDSRYQNLALIENAGQKTLYGNGQVMFSFPDEFSAERKAAFIMAQNPSATTILLIGGNPASDIPELLKYPIKSLVHVELDAAINFMLLRNAGPDYARALNDKRLIQYLRDGPRFVKETGNTFDIIIVEAPDPSTIALNRFYTVEFYRAISRILAPYGFLYTSIQSSEELQGEAGNLAASVFKSLCSVFPRVLAGYGTRNRFLAGNKYSPMTFDGKTLCERWRTAGVKAKYFRPEYFLNADEISPEKTSFVKQRLLALATPANTALRPVSSFYNLSLWSAYSGSRMESFLNALEKLTPAKVAAGMSAIFISFMIVIGIMAHRTTNKLSLGVILAPVIAATGFTGMAFELILIFMFQSLLGYIYASIGCLIAMFMLGLAGGAFWAGRFVESGGNFQLSTLNIQPKPSCSKLSVGCRMFNDFEFPRLKSSTCRRWFLLLALEVTFILIALLLPLVMKAGEIIAANRLVGGIIYSLIMLTGLAGGAQFVLAIDLMNENSNSESKIKNPKSKTGNAHHAALLNAADLVGAAMGSLVIGVIFLPLFGFAQTCCLLAMLKAGTFLLTGVFLIFRPQK